MLAASAGMLALLCPLLYKKDLGRVTYALVTSSLDYCNVLCMALPLKLSRKRQWVQNADGGKSQISTCDSSLAGSSSL